MTADHLSAQTRRRLARSPYAPLGGTTVLRTDVLCRLLVERLVSLGPTTEADAIEAIEWRAPGRGQEVIDRANLLGAVRRVVDSDDVVRLEAADAPRALAA
jgi:hypothetical protein